VGEFVRFGRQEQREEVSGTGARFEAGFSYEKDGGCVDDLDLDILRWMFPGGVRSPWGIDPRIPVAEIASHVGLNRTAVWARIRKWRREGFWNGLTVNPNFSIFGVGLLAAEIQVADSAEGCALMDQLEMIEGIVRAALTFGDSATRRDVEALGVFFVADDPIRISRRMGILRRLSPSGKVDGPYRRGSPECSRELTPLDWRVIAAMMANPNVPPSQLARLVGVSLKTYIRRQSTLIDDHAVFYVPKVDWSKLSCVTLTITCRDAGDVGRVRSAIETRFPHSIPISLEGYGIEGIAPDYDPSRCFPTIVPAHSPHELQTIVRDVSQVPGVKLVRPQLFGPSRQFPRWTNQHIAEHLAHPAAIQPSLIPQSLRSGI
jgi:DNA-binding Lrp family transcriptional regulator